MKKWLFALGALSVLIAQPRPASAAVTASFSLVGPNPLTAFCPVNVNFTGAINGPAGTKVTYIYARFVNGAPIDSQPVSATIPQNGSLALNEPLSIDLAHSGFQSNGVIVTLVNGVTPPPPAPAGKVFFTVNCSALNIPKGVIFVVQPPAPDSLTNTTDPPTCTNHAGLGGGIACLAGIPKGQLALIWNWSPIKGVADVDGYKVYRVDGGQHTLIYTQANRKDVTLALVDPPSDGFNGKCYVVTAYLGKGESHDSGYFCAGGYQGGPIVENFTAQLNNIDDVWHRYHFDGGGPGCGLTAGGTGADPGNNVGYWHAYDSSAGFTCSETTLVYQTAIGFNLGAAGIVLRNPKASVQNATLSFQRTDGTNTNCLAGVRRPTGDWTGAQGLIPATDFISNIPTGDGVSVNGGGVKIGGSSYQLDVTGAVNNWAKGVWTNYGLLLTGPNEDTSGYHDNNHCESKFGGFSLSIQVVISP